ncbi:MAG: putative N-carbamoyl-L-amino acid amidohydrolase [Ilumatobacteraceae bacterium]|nr:putative N-carbamoyl-L-amino acid amidohydrolase [Ilumatobacteraceae bacterium]
MAQTGRAAADLRVDGSRLWERIEALGEIGQVLGPNGERGCARLALTDADRDGRDLVVSWMLDLGLQVTVDAIGNVVGTRPGSDPQAAPVMTGSHIDTVRTGGRFDGNLGVLAGLEVIETLEQHGITTLRPIAVGFFTDEEGARFAPDMLGSLVYVGGLAVEEALDIVAVDDGATVGEELARIGYAGSTPCPAAVVPHAFVELHIEQGPVLEDEGIAIGVVTGVQGISWTELTIVGQSAHAGTTPMGMRHDPGYAAAAIIVAARELALRFGAGQVATVGRCEFTPDLVNVVPSEVLLTLDLRNSDDAVLQRAEVELRGICNDVAAAEGVTLGRRTLARFEPVEFDAGMIELVESTAAQLGLSSRRMPSGAGHDAQMLSRVCPTSMIFVPSVGGLSHNIAELTERADIEAGANVLLHTLLATATTP